MSGKKLVVTSKTFANTKELNHALLKFFDDVKFNTSLVLADNELGEYIGDAHGVIVGLEQIDDRVLSHCPNVEMIVKYGVGLDNIDLDACKRRNIEIGWTGGVNRLSVAEITLGMMLGLTRNIYKTSNELKNGVWDKNGGVQLSRMTVGIIGAGNIGKEVIRLLKPFNCRILVNDIIDQSAYYAAEQVKEASKEQIFKEANIVSLHVPLTPETKHLIDEKSLALMRNDAYVINTSRGLVIKLDSLKEALETGRIAGAALDVYTEEPPKDAELLSLPNLINTPHIAGNAKEAVTAMGMAAIEHLKYHFKKT